MDKILYFRTGDALTPARFWHVYAVYENSYEHRNAILDKDPQVTLTESEKARLPVNTGKYWGDVCDRYFL